VRARLRSLLHDTVRTARGAAHFCRLLATSDSLDLAVGALEVEPDSPAGRPALRCRVRVANTSPREREALLLLEIGPAKGDEGEAVFRLATRLRVTPLGVSEVVLEHDLETGARLWVDGRETQPNERATGRLPEVGLLAVWARLLESGNELHPPLTVFREIAP
jgi:hypothetical protein